MNELEKAVERLTETVMDLRAMYDAAGPLEHTWDEVAGVMKAVNAIMHPAG